MDARKSAGERRPAAGVSFVVDVWASVLACVLLLPTAALAVTNADRIEVYKEFRAQYDAKKYAEAQPLAERLVALTEEQYGAEDLALVNPLTNLATVHYKQGHYAAAIENYQRSLRILQAKSTLADKQQIRPLHGLGVSFMGANDPESAVVALKRATDLSRNTDGLFNINQVEFIDALIDAYEATGRYVEAEKEAGYAMRVEEAAYGRNSIKLLDRLDKLARWYEDSRRYTTERNVYERALAILAKSAPENDLRRVAPLRGIARSYRLEAFYGAEGADTGSTFNSGNPGAAVFVDGTQQRRGESSLMAALAIIDANSPADQQLRGEVLTDLGDWYLIANVLRRAYDAYADAWKALATVANTKLLESPRVLAYRPSISAVSRSQLDPTESTVKTIELHFKVDRDGKIDDVTSPTTDVPDLILKNSISSIKRSRFAPRIENGAAVPTLDVIFLEKVLVRLKPLEGESPSGKAEGKTSAEKPEKPAEKPADSQEQTPAPETSPPPANH
jgi:tetratricopeptide (TPR) repeat protein